jgi:hypothetical protein
MLSGTQGHEGPEILTAATILRTVSWKNFTDVSEELLPPGSKK